MEYEAKLSVCERFNLAPVKCPGDSKVGISQTALDGALPLNGLRHRPENGTSGWFFWGGNELSAEDNFFLPLHASHLVERCPLVVPYLELPPGWRFLLAEDYEDVWFDQALLKITT